MSNTSTVFWQGAGPLLLGAFVLTPILLLYWAKKASAAPAPSVTPIPGLNPACAIQLTVIQGLLANLKPQLDACIANPGETNESCKTVTGAIGPVLKAFQSDCGAAPGVPSLPGLPSVPGVPQPPSIPDVTKAAAKPTSGFGSYRMM